MLPITSQVKFCILLLQNIDFFHQVLYFLLQSIANYLEIYILLVLFLVLFLKVFDITFGFIVFNIILDALKFFLDEI